VMTRKSTIVALLALLLAASVAVSSISLTVAAPETADASASEPRPPKVIQLSYREGHDGWGPDRGVKAWTRRTDSLTFRARYRGRQASVPARLTDTVDANLPRCCNQAWQPIRKEGGSRVTRLIHKSLEQRGVARVRTRARRDGLVDDHRWRIVLAQCAQEPPIYPVDCEIAPNGGHY
jgi:hypothetical protein